jgi:LIVCS family branched-chain amino acid:cation transporter
MNNTAPSRLVLGLALFSMFFGSGNLIFPLFLGQVAQHHWLVALCGFLLTAVCLPLLGVFAMVLYEGHYRKFFGLLGKPLGFLLTLLLLVVWIPLGSGPRCVSLSYVSLGTYLPMGSPWVYGAIYSILCCFVVLQGRGMLKILGKFLTPLLLFCLAAIFTAGFFGGPSAQESAVSTKDLFVLSLTEGYNTQDLIASFFFSASVIGLLQMREGSSLSSNLKLTFQAGIIATITLGVVYASLLYTAANHSLGLTLVPKEQMLAQLAKITLGENLGVIAAIAIFLACFTTSVALMTVFTEFLTDSIFGNKSWYNFSLGITLFASYLMSITGLEGITAVTAPVLQICYPLLLVVILWGIAKKNKEHFSFQLNAGK